MFLSDIDPWWMKITSVLEWSHCNIWKGFFLPTPYEREKLVLWSWMWYPVMMALNWHTSAITFLFPRSKGSTLDFYRQFAFRTALSLLALDNACFLGIDVIRFQKKMEWDNAIITHDYSFCSCLSSWRVGASCLVFHKLRPVVMVLIHFMNQSGGDVSKK